MTDGLERIIEANTLLSGLGFESSGPAAAHFIHNDLIAVPEIGPYLHGEPVLSCDRLPGVPENNDSSIIGNRTF